MADFIDLSHILNSIQPAEPDESGLPLNGFTLSGTFDTRPVCALCGVRFAPGPEGLASLTHPALGRIFPVCPCATSLLSAPSASRAE